LATLPLTPQAFDNQKGLTAKIAKKFDCSSLRTRGISLRPPAVKPFECD